MKNVAYSGSAGDSPFGGRTSISQHGSVSGGGGEAGGKGTGRRGGRGGAEHRRGVSQSVAPAASRKAWSPTRGGHEVRPAAIMYTFLTDV